MSTENTLYFRSFLLLLAIVSIAFLWVLLPFYGAVFWGGILAIIFAPLQQRFLAYTHGRKTLSAFITLLIIILIVIIPVLLLMGALIKEVAHISELLKTASTSPDGFLIQFSEAELEQASKSAVGMQFFAVPSDIANNLASYPHVLFKKIQSLLPSQLQDIISRALGDDFDKLRTRATEFMLNSGRYITKQAVSFGSNTFQFVVSLGVMLYLLFFLLRDGAALGRRCRQLAPLSDEQKVHLMQKLTTVIRATVKGNIAVAAIQGLLGGIAFAVLGLSAPVFWGVLMAILSLLPAVGASLIWGPVAIYYFAVGEYVHGIALTAVGIFVIGLVDNILRPILVGKDTKIPDYVILISTLGGMSLFGLNGFVIGPLVAAIFMACWDLFPAAMSRRNQELENERQGLPPADQC